MSAQKPRHRAGMYKAVRGHAPRPIAPGRWECKCGVPLSGGPFGNGQRGARDVMRFHRADLWMAMCGEA